DLAGNQGQSATVSLTVSSSGSGYATTDLSPHGSPITPGLVPTRPIGVGFAPRPRPPAPPPSPPRPPGPLPPPRHLPPPRPPPPPRSGRPRGGPRGPPPPRAFTGPPTPPPPPVPAPLPRLGDPLLPLLQRGNLQVSHDLDWDLSPGTDVGGSPALMYN